MAGLAGICPYVVGNGGFLVRLGALALAMALPLALSGQPQSQPNQSVPDAPVPQAQGDLSGIAARVTPGQGSSTEPPADTAPPAPAAPTPDTPPDQVQQTAPDVPVNPDQAKQFLLRVPVNFVSIPTTVLDKKHQQVAGLTWRNFEIYENNDRQRIAFFSADSVPLSVALVIDQGLPQDVMRKVNNSLAALGGAFTAGDEVAVFTYSDGVNNPTVFTAAQGARLPAVLEQAKTSGDYMDVPVNGGPFYGGPRINGQSVDPNLEPQRDASGTFGVVPKEVHTLNDAILAAGQALSTREKGRRRIIYVISDGKESRSKTPFKQVVRYLQTNQISVYGTLVGDSATWGLGYLDKVKLPLLPLSPDNILPRYADQTGGQLYAEFSENGIQRSFAELAALARTQYTLGYYSHIPLLDGKFRNIDVRVLRPNLSVIAPKGYYPLASNLSSASN
jgi:VWFA-related protein